MAEKPPAWAPFDSIGQVPLALSQNVDVAGVPRAAGLEALARAAQIVREQQPVINRFVARQRQQITIGGLDIHKAVLPLKDMDVFYSYVQGIERMHYHISPQVDVPPEVPEAPEEKLETPVLPQKAPPEEEPKEELPEEEPPEEPPEEEELPKEEPVLEQPDFLEVAIPCFLAVEFDDGAD